jgi:hypothetical protein
VKLAAARLLCRDARNRLCSAATDRDALDSVLAEVESLEMTVCRLEVALALDDETTNRKDPAAHA